MIPIKCEEEIVKMREACQIAAQVLDKLCSKVAPGVNTYDIDQTGKELIASFGAQSACFNYQVGKRSFPAYTCLSVNEEIVHGIGSMKRVLRVGDNITIDVVVLYNGFVGDNARTILIKPVSEEMEYLVTSTEAALFQGIKQARSGNRVGDISNSVQKFVEARDLAIVRDFVGHGIGRLMHEEPQIPNYGTKGTGIQLRSGMTLAIEPMVNLGKPEIEVGPDGWTALTRDRKPAAHFEHTVLITDKGPEILTIAKN